MASLHYLHSFNSSAFNLALICPGSIHRRRELTVMITGADNWNFKVNANACAWSAMNTVGRSSGSDPGGQRLATSTPKRFLTVSGRPSRVSCLMTICHMSRCNRPSPEALSDTPLDGLLLQATDQILSRTIGHQTNISFARLLVLIKFSFIV